MNGRKKYTIDVCSRACKDRRIRFSLYGPSVLLGVDVPIRVVINKTFESIGSICAVFHHMFDKEKKMIIGYHGIEMAIGRYSGKVYGVDIAYRSAFCEDHLKKIAEIASYYAERDKIASKKRRYNIRFFNNVKFGCRAVLKLMQTLEKINEMPR